jgi:hypothetical protein
VVHGYYGRLVWLVYFLYEFTDYLNSISVCSLNYYLDLLFQWIHTYLTHPWIHFFNEFVETMNSHNLCR